ncbi:hypothetical protein PFISCL1PPCAC_16253, partial [Pristionchus fissidentatus]
KITERRSTCFCLDTAPFGLVTYPTDIDLPNVPSDISIGDHLRVRILRFKTSKTDHPSKWQVTSVLKRLPKPTENDDWFEAIVTCLIGPRIFFSFKHGNAMCMRNCNLPAGLSLGTVVDIRVKDTGNESYFEVVGMKGETMRREDVTVEKIEGAERGMFTVFCRAEVMERREGFFLLHTPIIGLAIYFFRESPKSMKVGEEWEIKMHRRKEKKDLPSYWVAHGVVSDWPLNTPTQRSNEERWREEDERGRREGRRDEIWKDELRDWKSEKRKEEEKRLEEQRWHTVIITGVKNGHGNL